MRSKRCTYNGQIFDSQAELKRYKYLLALQEKKQISELKCQVRYALIPAQYEEIETGEFYTKGEKKGQPKKKRVCVEQAVTYIADFTYMMDGELVVEDTKGFTHYKNGGYNGAYNVFSIKRKLMLYIHGIKVKEMR